MVWASPKGGLAPLDAGSIEATKDDEFCQTFATDPKLTKLWKQTKPLATVQTSEYDAVFYVGGFGTMWDFPDDPNVQRVAREMYEQRGVVAAVCHGPCALVNVKLGSGELLMKGHACTAFSNKEEDAVKCRKIVPFTCQDKFTAIGAEFRSLGDWESNVVVCDDEWFV